MNSPRMGCDRISELSDCLLSYILSYLGTKDCVKTSVLSKRWEFICLKVSELDLNIPHRDGNITLVGFMKKFLEFNHGSCLKKFKIKYNPFITTGFSYYPLMEWIDELVNRGLEYLDVENEVCPNGFDVMTKNVFVSKTLVSLKLVRVALEEPGFVVSLPCLKIMHLEETYYYKRREGYNFMAYESGDGLLIVEKLISGSPVLENITLEFHSYGERKQVDSFSTNVPQCLSSTLEYVTINKRVISATGMKLLRYFLENSAVLKNLTLSCKGSQSHKTNVQETEFYKKLLTSTKLSPICQIGVSCFH